MVLRPGSLRLKVLVLSMLALIYLVVGASAVEIKMVSLCSSSFIFLGQNYVDAAKTFRRCYSQNEPPYHICSQVFWQLSFDNLHMYNCVYFSHVIGFPQFIFS